MAEDVLLLYFPDEVLEHILENENLSCKDIYNFGSTCSKFRKVIDSNKLWKAKFHQRWPSVILSGVYKGQESIDWKDQYATRVRIGIAVTNLLNEMSPAFYKKEELCNTDFSMFLDLILVHNMALRFMIDELMNLVNDKDMYNNLTNKYYGTKVLTYLRHIDVARKWKIFKTEPPEKQILERGAVLVAQWCQPDLEITDESISKQLDFIANWVRSVIKEEYGERHPALCISPEVLEEWRTTNIDDNKYNPTVSRQVIKAVSEVLFKHMGFHGNSEMYYLPENSYINRVLENRQGIPITLSIVFESVTRRLGIKCEPVSFPGHFLLRWRDRYEKQKEVDGTTSPNVSSCSIVKSGDHYTSGSELMLLVTSHHGGGFTGQPQYIDVFNGGKFLTKESCPNFSAQSRCPMSELFRHGPASAIQVVERMANNLEVAGRQRNHINGRLARLRAVLELLRLINPLNLSSLSQLARLYMLCNLHMDIVTLLDNINNMVVTDPRDLGQAAHIKRMLELYLTQEQKRKEYQVVKESTVRLREGNNDGVAYSVGMVMHHIQYDYTCVIYGWDSKCAADPDWKIQMHVNSLARQDDQPFYNVLVNDGSTRYAAEDNLEISIGKNALINHHEIGRYFHTFCGTHYLPNNEKEKEYPHDAEVRNLYYSHLN